MTLFGIPRYFFPLIRTILKQDVFLPLVTRLLVYQVKHLGNAIQPRHDRSDSRIRLFVLNEERFRENLKIISRRDDVDLIAFKSPQIQHLINALHTSHIRSLVLEDPTIYFDSSNEIVQTARANLHTYLSKLLARLQEYLEFDGILTCSFIYRKDKEWESSSIELGIPYFVLYRENTKDPATYGQTLRKYRSKQYHSFCGTRLFLACEAERYLLRKADCLPDDKIRVIGLVRLDDLFNRAKIAPEPINTKRVLLFSTHHRLGGLVIEDSNYLFSNDHNIGFVKHFSLLHGIVGQFAIDHPSIEVVIKTKWLFNWQDQIDNAIQHHTKRQLASIRNIRITDAESPYDLITSSNVVIGLNSMALVEAKLVNAPVILPIFEEASGKYFESHVFFKKYMDCFSIANSGQDLYNKMKSFTDDANNQQPSIPEEMIREYVGNFDGQATTRFVEQVRRDIVVS